MAIFSDSFQIGANEIKSMAISMNDMRRFTLGVTTVKIADNGVMAVGASTTTDIQQGTYNVSKADNGTYNLLDTTEKTVTTSADGQTFKVGTKDVLTLTADSALADKGTVTIHGVDVSNKAAASSAITTIQKALDNVSAERSNLGAYQNRLEHTINNLGTSSENLTSAESRIRDVNMAKEMSQFSKNNILSQAAQAMLAQANQHPQQVLQLLR